MRLDQRFLLLDRIRLMPWRSEGRINVSARDGMYVDEGE
jgi:hypothetical protein